jgi:DNA-directed RNA polymerase subunit L
MVGTMAKLSKKINSLEFYVKTKDHTLMCDHNRLS